MPPSAAAAAASSASACMFGAKGNDAARAREMAGQSARTTTGSEVVPRSGGGTWQAVIHRMSTAQASKAAPAPCHPPT
jgi:hypothetical protein